ncbi:M56 family metallopeptidase [Streptomyces sp. NPDC001941]|uniref:M56 family metallopeptidase n=1 Tax=Streptomyces sp. NPDC001941 TaxID=3154659 RepID=UPI00332C4E23
MIVLLLLPLALPWALPPLLRRYVHAVRPDIALWVTAGASFALAVGVISCLGVLLLPLALHVPALAALAELLRPLRVGPPLPVLATSVLSAAALAAAATAVVRGASREVRGLRATRRRVTRLPAAGGLCVVDDARPEAFALPLGVRGRGRIVVSSGMLRALGPGEREALLAHERAHLSRRHHLPLAAAQLAGWCHPALAAALPDIAFAAERDADERAARACGDRGLIARAVGRAALATARGRRGDGLPSVAPAATGGPVPARVRALLSGAPARRFAPALAAVVLLCAAAGSLALAGAVSVHRGVEVAQGEHPAD